MNTKNITNINLEKLALELEKHENEWVAISDENRIIANGSTYRETADRVQDKENVVLFKVPQLNVSLAP